MAEYGDDVIRELGLPSDLRDILVNLLVVVKLQQLNIDLLWEAYASGKPPAAGLAQVRESNLRLAASMEQMVSAILANNLTGNLRPD
jgi:hypothetical protein